MAQGDYTTITRHHCLVMSVLMMPKVWFGRKQWLGYTPFSATPTIPQVTCIQEPLSICTRPHWDWLIEQLNDPSLPTSKDISAMEEDLVRMEKHVPHPHPMTRTKKNQDNDKRRDKRRDDEDDEILEKRVTELSNMLEPKIEAQVQVQVRVEAEVQVNIEAEVQDKINAEAKAEAKINELKVKNKVLFKPTNPFVESLVVGNTIHGDVAKVGEGEADEGEADDGESDDGEADGDFEISEVIVQFFSRFTASAKNEISRRKMKWDYPDHENCYSSYSSSDCDS